MIQGMFVTNGRLALQKALEARMLSHQAISYNIANVDTPGFKRVEIRFQDALKAALEERSRSGRPGWSLGREGTDPVSRVRAELVVDDAAPTRADGNNVDIDREAVNLAENAGSYLALAELLSRSFEGVRSAIRETVR